MKKTILSIGFLISSVAFAQNASSNCAPPAQAPIGSPVPGLTPQQLALFNQGKAAYEHVFTPAQGVGPLFRGQSCVTCHGFPVTGGGEQTTVQNVTHFMINNQDNFFLALEFGGPVQQHHSVAELGSACPIQPEVVPSFPQVTTSSRHAPPVFGFGLLDAVSDRDILEYQGRKPWKDPSVIGIANWGVEMESLVRLQAFAFDINRKQPAGIPRVGRFGWKAQTGSLFQFSAEPANIELGLTSPWFPRENTPNGAPPPASCLVPGLQPNDTGSNNSLNFLYFQGMLAPPPTKPLTPQAAYGAVLFVTTGCADCHRPSFRTMKDYYMPLPDGTAMRVDALSDKVIKPYSDLLTHDMGAGNKDGRIMGRAGTTMWRTTPLWGARFKGRYMHDGRAATIDEAIDLHGGEAASSTAKYEALTNAQEAALLAFIDTL